MKLNTFYQVCVYICLCMIILTLSISFVNELGVFEITTPPGYTPADTSPETFENLSNIQNETAGGLGIDDLWIVILTGAGMGAIVIAWITKSPVVLGVYVFSVVFWAAYMNTIVVLDVISYLPAGFVFIGTTAMFFVWAGAIAGMLSGSG